MQKDTRLQHVVGSKEILREPKAESGTRARSEYDYGGPTVAQQLSAGVCGLLRGDGASTGTSWRHWKSIAGTGNSLGANMIGMAVYENTFDSAHSHLSSK